MERLFEMDGQLLLFSTWGEIAFSKCLFWHQGQGTALGPPQLPEFPISKGRP